MKENLETVDVNELAKEVLSTKLVKDVDAIELLPNDPSAYIIVIRGNAYWKMSGTIPLNFLRRRWVKVITIFSAIMLAILSSYPQVVNALPEILKLLNKQ